MNLEINAVCYTCNKKFIIDNSFTYDCEDCLEKNSNELLNTFIDHIIDRIDSRKLDDITYDEHSGMIGFKSEEEKETFMRGLKYGCEMNIRYIVDTSHDYGIDFNKKLEELESVWKKQRIDKRLCHPDKNRCDKCKGNGYLE